MITTHPLACLVMPHGHPHCCTTELSVACRIPPSGSAADMDGSHLRIRTKDGNRVIVDQALGGWHLYRGGGARKCNCLHGLGAESYPIVVMGRHNFQRCIEKLAFQPRNVVQGVLLKVLPWWSLVVWGRLLSPKKAVGAFAEQVDRNPSIPQHSPTPQSPV